MDGHHESKEKQLAGLLAGLDRIFREDFKRRNGMPVDLTLAQYQVISLAHEHGKCSQTQLATHLGVTGPTVVRIVDALEKKELARRTRDGKDRRVVWVSLTEKGVAAQEESARLLEQRLAQTIDRLPPATTDTLLANLSELLRATTAS